jgi:hypothetical protein
VIDGLEVHKFAQAMIVAPVYLLAFAEPFMAMPASQGALGSRGL